MKTKLSHAELLKFLLTVKVMKALSSKTTFPVIQDDTIDEIINGCDCCSGSCVGCCIYENPCAGCCSNNAT